ncbi:MAG: hypothetical protein U5R06_06630 [candidate division KSB1 bacterium]|nr:hypothetical protein [candidate division KSB1 bacterium]
MTDKKHDFYQKLRQKVVKWAESREAEEHPWSKYILWAPDLFYTGVETCVQTASSASPNVSN